MTEMHIGMDEAVRLLRQAVLHKGENYVYGPTGDIESCRYTMGYEDHRDDAPLECGCIIGTALHLEGVPLEHMARVDRVGAFGVGHLISKLNSMGHYISITSEALELWEGAQNQQDLGDTWGRVLTDAEHEYDGWAWDDSDVD